MKESIPVAASRLRWSLLGLRAGVAIVMIMWTFDKFVAPQHAAGVFANFYGIDGLGTSALAIIGLAQLLVVAAFTMGAFRTISYGLVLAMHTVSTLSSYAQYLDPFNHLLFFAAWPMLAACAALFALRDHDTLLNWDARE